MKSKLSESGRAIAVKDISYYNSDGIDIGFVKGGESVKYEIYKYSAIAINEEKDLTIEMPISEFYSLFTIKSTSVSEVDMMINELNHLNTLLDVRYQNIKETYTSCYDRFIKLLKNIIDFYLNKEVRYAIILKFDRCKGLIEVKDDETNSTIFFIFIEKSELDNDNTIRMTLMREREPSEGDIFIYFKTKGIQTLIINFNLHHEITVCETNKHNILGKMNEQFNVLLASKDLIKDFVYNIHYFHDLIKSYLSEDIAEVKETIKLTENIGNFNWLVSDLEKVIQEDSQDKK